ncbi:MAG: hypothetical protein ACOX6W_04600 [Lentisphaeria bacterium]
MPKPAPYPSRPQVSGSVLLGNGGPEDIIISAADQATIDAGMNIEFHGSNTLINAFNTTLTTGANGNITLDNATVNLTGTSATIDTSNVSNAGNGGTLAAQLANLTFNTVDAVTLNGLDLAAVGQTKFNAAAVTVTADAIALGKTHAAGALTLTGALTLHGPLNADGKLTIGTYGVSNARNAFDNAEITANEIDILASEVTGGIFSAATTAKIDSINNVTEAIITANNAVLTTGDNGNIFGVEVTALNDATLTGRSISATTISAGGAANVTGITQIVDSVIAAGGTATLAGKEALTPVNLRNNTVTADAITANANIGNIAGGTYISTGATTLAAANGIGGLTVQAGGNATLTASAGDIVNATVEGAAVGLTANVGNISNVIVDASGNANLAAQGATSFIADSSVTAQQQATLQAFVVSGNTISAGTNASVTGTSQIVGNVINANGTATLAGADPNNPVNLINNTVAAAGITANTDIDNIFGGTYTSSGAATLAADGNILSSTVTAATDATLTAAQIAGTTVDALNVANLTATAIGGTTVVAGVNVNVDGTIAESSLTAQTGEVTIKNAALGITNVTASAGGDIEATEGIAWIAGGSFIASGDVDLTTTYTILDAAVEGETVTLTAAPGTLGATAIGNVDVSARDSATADVTGDISNSSILAENAATLTLTGDLNNNTVTAGEIGITGLANVENGSYVSQVGSLKVDASGNIEGATFTAEAADVVLDADGNILSSTVTAATDATLTAAQIAGTTVDALNVANLFADAIAGTTVDALNVANLTADAIGGTTVVAGVDVNVDGTIAESSLTAQTGDVTIKNAALGITNVTASAGGDIDATEGIAWIAGGSFIAAGDVDLTTTYTILDAAVEGETVTLTAAPGTLGATAIGNVDVSARDSATLDVTGDISNSSILAENAAKLTLTGDLNNNTVTAGEIGITGLANVENGSYVSQVGSLTVDASGNIEGATFTAEAADVVLDADGNILSSTVTAATDATLTAAQIAGTTVDALNVANLTADAIAGTTVDALNVANLTADAIGGTTVVAGVDVNVDGTIAESSLTAQTGDVTIKNAALGITNVTASAGGDIDATEGIAWIAGGSFIAAGDVDLTTTYTILDAAVEGENVTLTAAPGTLGATAIGNVDVSARDSATLDVTGDISNSSILAENAATLTLTGDLNNNTVTAGEIGITGLANVENGSYVSQVGSLKVDASGNIEGATFTAEAADVVLDADGNILSSTVTAATDATLTAAQIAGTTVDALNVANLFADAIAGTTVDALNVANLTADAIGGTTVVAGVDVNVDGTIAESSLTAQTGDVTIKNAALGITNVTASAGGDIDATEGIAWIAGGSFIAAGDVDLTTTYTILDAAVEGETVTLTAAPGTLGATAIGNVDVSARDSATLDVTGDISNSSILAENAAKLTLTGDLNNNTVTAGEIGITGLANVENGSYVSQVGSLTVGASGNIEGATFTAEAADVVLDADGNILSSTVTAATDATLTAAQIAGTTVDALNVANLTATAIGGTTVVAGVNVNVDGTIAESSLTAQTGKVTIKNAALGITNVTASAGGDIEATEGIAWIAGGSFIASGDVDLTTTYTILDAAVEGETVTLTAAPGTLSATAIGNVDVSARDSATLDVTGDISNSSILAENAAKLTLTGDLNNNTVTAGEIGITGLANVENGSYVSQVGSLTVGASGNIEGATFTAEAADVVLDADGNILSSTVTAATDATLTAAQIAGTTVDALNVANLTADAIAGTTVDALNVANLTADAIGGTTVVAGVDVNVDGTIAESSLTAQTGDVTIKNAALGITNVTASAGGDIDATEGIAWIAGGSFIAAGDVDLTTTYTILDAAVEGENVTLTAAPGTLGATAIGNVDVSARDSATLDVTGDISNSSILAENAATLTLTGDLNNNTVTAGEIGITGLANVENGSYVSQVGSLKVDASGNIEGATFTAEAADVVLDADGNILSSTVTAATDATLTAAQIAGTTVDALNVANLFADAIAGTTVDALNVANLTADAIGGTTVVAGVDVNVDGTIAESSLTAQTGDVTIKNAALGITNVTASAGGDIDATEGIAWIAGGSFIAAGDVDLTTTYTILDAAVEGETVTLTAAPGTLGATAIGNVDVSARDSATLDVTGDISNSSILAENAAKLTLTGDLNNNTVTAGEIGITGLANVENGSYVSQVGSLTVGASGNIEGATFTAEAADVVLDADGNILSSTVTAATDATLTAAQIAGTTVDALNVANLFADAIGGATVVAGTGVNVTGTIAESSLTAQTGDITIKDAVLGITNVTASAGTGDIVAVDNIGWVAGGSFIATGDVNLTATYTILDAAVEGENVTLTAAPGTLGATAIGNVDVSARDSATLDVTGDISNSSILAENAATLTLTGDLNNNTVTAGEIGITGLVNVENGSYVSQVGSLTVDASGNIEGATFTAEAADVVLDADGNILSSTVTAATDATLTAAQIAGTTVDALNVANLTADAIGGTTVVAGVDVNVDGTIAESSLTAQTGDVTIKNAALGITNVTASAGGDIDATEGIAWIAGGSFIAAGDVDLTTTYTILDAAVEGETVTLTAAPGTLGATAIGNVDVSARDSATLDVTGDISNSSILAENAATLTLTGDLNNNTVTAGEIGITGLVNVENGSYVSQVGSLTVGASGNIEGATFTAEAADVVLDADGNILSSTVTAATDATLTAAQIAGTTVDALNVANLTADAIGGTTVVAGVDVNVDGTIAESSLTAQTGKVTIKNAALGITNVTASAGGDIEATEGIAWIAGGSFIASGDVDLTTTYTILDAAVEGETVTLTAAPGTLSATAIGNVDVSARDSAVLTVTGDISNSSILAENAATLTLTGDLNNDTVTAGSIAISGLANVENGSYVSQVGSLKVDASGNIEGATFTAEAEDVILDADGAILSSTVTAATGANLTAALIAETGVMAGADIATSGSLSNSSLTAGGDIELTNAAYIDNLDAVSAGAITAVDNIGVITGGSLIATDATTVSATSIRGTAFDAATADLTGADDIQAILVRVGTNAKLSSTSIVDSNVLVSQADGSIEVKATAIDGGSLRADEVTFDEFVADADTQIGAASAVRVLGAENITVVNGGLVNIVSENDGDTAFTVTASDDVFLTQGNGDMRVDITADGQTVTLTAAADIGPVASGTVAVTAKDLIITTAQNVDLRTTIEQVKADVAYDFKLVETDDLKIDLVSAGRKAYIQTDNGGDILDSADDTILDIVTPQLTLLASGSIGTADNALDISTQKLLARAGDTGLINLLNVSNQDVTVDGLTAGTSVTLKTQGSGAHIFDDSVSAYDGDVIIDSAAGDLVFTTSSSVFASDNVAITAYGDVSSTGNFISLKAEDGDLDIVSKHGSIGLSSGTTAEAGNDLTIVALENDVFMAGSLNAGRDITIAAEGWLHSTGTMLAGRDVDIYTYEEAILEGPITATTGGVTVYAETGELEVHAPITAATEINLETEDDRIDINAALTAADVTLTSMNGDILSSDTGTIDAATIEANTGGKVDLDGKLTASDWVDIEAVGSVTAADIESGDVTVKTTGTNANIDINLTATLTDLVARAEGIDSDIFIKGNDLNLNEVYAYDGDVNVDATGFVDVFKAHALDEGVVNGVEDDAHSVIIKARRLNARYNSIVSDYDVELELTGSGSFASESVLAGNDIFIYALGEIQDSSNTNMYNLIAAGDITLWTGDRIGDPSGGNPFDVSAGGDVNVGAIDGSPAFSGKHDSIWVFMMGESGDGSIHYLGDTSTPPGLIWWNAMVWGGSEEALIEIDRAEGGFSREVRDLADRYISQSWHFNFLYFPHVRAYFDEEPGNMSIEHILDGEGVIEGLPEGVTPTEFNLNDLDDSYTWYDGSK